MTFYKILRDFTAFRLLLTLEYRNTSFPNMWTTLSSTLTNEQYIGTHANNCNISNSDLSGTQGCNTLRRQIKLKPFFLNTWLRASWFNINKGPTRCNSMQTFIHCHVTLHVSGVTHPSSGVLKTVSATSGVCHGNGTVASFHRGLIRTDQATVEGSNGTITMTYTRGSRYSF